MARELVGPGEFIEVFVDTPLEVASSATRRASTQGAAPARSRISPASSRPMRRRNTPKRRIDTAQWSPEQSVQALLDYFGAKKLINLG